MGARKLNGLDWVKITEDTVRFEIYPTQIISYEELPKAVNFVFNYFSRRKTELIKISGRGPIWLYCAVVHAVAHLAKAVAVYDAVNSCYVVVVSHHPNYRIGDRFI